MLHRSYIAYRSGERCDLWAIHFLDMSATYESAMLNSLRFCERANKTLMVNQNNAMASVYRLKSPTQSSTIEAICDLGVCRENL